jgi:hypothetical protein
MTRALIALSAAAAAGSVVLKYLVYVVVGQVEPVVQLEEG